MAGKKVVLGVLAHVDSGKTTLSEAMLFLSGAIRKLGRVDNKDAYLDNYELERARGITIFSKQAEFEVGDTQITLLDTPGHVDFSAEMERTLQVLDYAVLVVSGADGIQGHTQTLWRLLSLYHIPTFLFVNKMDQNGTDKNKLLYELKHKLSDGCIDFGQDGTEEFYDELAMCEEVLMEEFLAKGTIEKSEIIRGIKARKVFPCYFGSALKLDGVEQFMRSLAAYTEAPVYPKEFGAKVFKISRDEQDARLTFLKITGGSIKVRTVLTNRASGEAPEEPGEEYWEEKVNQIRIYSGQKCQVVNELEAGSVCAVTGLTRTYAGQGLGIEATSTTPLIEPVLSYQILLKEGYDPRRVLPLLRKIEEEEPELHIVWNEDLQEIQAQIMGEVQLEVLKELVNQRFGIEIGFGEGNILYKETISSTVEGVGHFEPLRHYAEVHLLLEPGDRGSGLQFELACSEDELDRNWQRLILTHLMEREHRGVLTGSAITDMKITLVAGRSHKKHTEGGDFREATYRAVRQGLKEAESVLLEPYYEFQLELPEKMVGRAMTDIEKLCGTCVIAHTEGGIAVLHGTAPVVTMKNYQREVIAYTKGYGRLFCSLKGYERCHNEQEVVEAFGYDSERDVMNPTGSVFCAHGAGFLVNWDQVKDYMHIETFLDKKKENVSEDFQQNNSSEQREEWIGVEEIDQILEKTFYANRGNKTNWKRSKPVRRMDDYPAVTLRNTKEVKEEYLLVDGYNIIFAWSELRELAEANVDSARIKLMDCLCNYQGIKKCTLILVFDAYRLEGHPTEIFDYHNIHVVYTKEKETADQYIEKFVHLHAKTYHVTVATSDGLEQIIIRGQGSSLLSARELKEEVERVNENAIRTYQEKQASGRHFLFDSISEESGKQIEAIRRKKVEEEK